MVLMLPAVGDAAGQLLALPGIRRKRQIECIQPKGGEEQKGRCLSSYYIGTIYDSRVSPLRESIFSRAPHDPPEKILFFNPPVV